MKTIAAVSLLAFSGAIASSQATVLFSDNFDSYSNGNLVNQGPWLQTGTSTTSPVQVSSGQVVIGATGQDVYAPLSSIYTIPDGTTFDLGFTLNVSSAQTTGDYFLHTTPTVGNSTLFYDRIFVKSSGSGFVLGYEGTAGTGAVVNYGTTVLNLNTSYRIVMVYNDVAGAVNDTASLYVNPADTSVEANNTAYINQAAWTSSNGEGDVVAAVNFRQGTTGSAPTETVDDLVAGTQFGDVSVFPVPEPSSLVLLGLGSALGVCFFGRRKK